MTTHRTGSPGMAHPTVVPANADRGETRADDASTTAAGEQTCPECGHRVHDRER